MGANAVHQNRLGCTSGNRPYQNERDTAPHHAHTCRAWTLISDSGRSSPFHTQPSQAHSTSSDVRSETWIRLPGWSDVPDELGAA